MGKDHENRVSVERGTRIASIIEGLDKLYSLEGSAIAYRKALELMADLDEFVWEMVAFVGEDSEKYPFDHDNDGLIVCTVCDGTEETGHEDDCPIALGL